MFDRNNRILKIFFTFQSVQDTYVNAVSNLKFGGPTCLAHVIEKAANLSERENMSQNKQVYTVLLVITVCICNLIVNYSITIVITICK